MLSPDVPELGILSEHPNIVRIYDFNVDDIAIRNIDTILQHFTLQIPP
ncbi:hypothetical protein [Stygiolobus sp. RP850M]